MSTLSTVLLCPRPSSVETAVIERSQRSTVRLPMVRVPKQNYALALERLLSDEEKKEQRRKAFVLMSRCGMLYLFGTYLALVHALALLYLAGR